MPLPNNYTFPCLKILEEIDLTSELVLGNVVDLKSSLAFFYPVRHIPPKIPITCYILTMTQSMQNIQRLSGPGGCSKYVCKYLAKVDEQNYVVILVDGQGQLAIQAKFLHNTKITSTKMGENKNV